MKYHPELLHAKKKNGIHFVRRVGRHLNIKKKKNVFRNGQKSAKCALSVILLRIAMAALAG